MGGPDADLPTLLERVSNAFMLDWLSAKEGVELVLFARTFVRAVGAPDEARASVERWNARLYVAFVDGDPAGAGALSILDGVGHLANVATIPALRGRGVQTALIRRRIRDAAA